MSTVRTEFLVSQNSVLVVTNILGQGLSQELSNDVKISCAQNRARKFEKNRNKFEKKLFNLIIPPPNGDVEVIEPLIQL